MTMPPYDNGKSIMTTTCYKNGDDDDKSDNNKDKVYLLLKRWDLIDHVLDHILDHMFNYMIIGLVTTALHKC